MKKQSLECSIKKLFSKISQDSQENTCVGVSFLIKLQACNFVKKETLTQMSSCQFCEIFKNTFFYRTSPVTASEDGNLPPRTEFSVLNVPVKFKLKICRLNKMLVS